MWEDKANLNGGRWLVTLNNNYRFHGLDNFWREVMLYLIGGETETDVINGAVANIRNKGDKISIWLSIATCDKIDGPKILDIGRRLKERMKIPEHITIHFEIHKQAQNKRGSVAKFAYTI